MSNPVPCGRGTSVLCKEYYEVHFSEFDRQMFRAFVPAGHYLREALRVIAWDDFYEILSPYYSEKAGRPAVPSRT